MNKEVSLSQNELETLARAGVIPMNTPLPIVQVFAETCKQHALSPFKKEIYLIKTNTKDGDKYYTVVGIDGARAKATRTGQYAGKSDVKYNLKADGTYQTAAEVKASGKLPISATVTVKRVVCGVVAEFTHTALFNEFYPSVSEGKSSFSKASQMPFQMIAKVAESFALKQGFSDELSGLHVEEEREAFNDPAPQIPIPQKKKEELTPEHKNWNDAIAALRKNPGWWDDLKNRFEISPENEELIKDQLQL